MNLIIEVNPQEDRRLKQLILMTSLVIFIAGIVVGAGFLLVSLRGSYQVITLKAGEEKMAEKRQLELKRLQQQVDALSALRAAIEVGLTVTSNRMQSLEIEKR